MQTQPMTSWQILKLQRNISVSECYCRTTLEPKVKGTLPWWNNAAQMGRWGCREWGGAGRAAGTFHSPCWPPQQEGTAGNSCNKKGTVKNKRWDKDHGYSMFPTHLLWVNMCFMIRENRSEPVALQQQRIVLRRWNAHFIRRASYNACGLGLPMSL